MNTNLITIAMAMVALFLPGRVAASDGAAILEAVQNHYVSVSDVSIDYTQVYTQDATGETTEQKFIGRLIAARGTPFGHVRLEEQDGLVSIARGRVVASFPVVQRGKDTIQIEDVSTNLTLNPFWFLMNGGSLPGTFTAELNERKTDGTVKLSMTPKLGTTYASKGLQLAQLLVDAEYRIQGWVLRLLPSASGGTNQSLAYHCDSMSENNGVPSQTFSLEAPEGVDVVDLTKWGDGKRGMGYE